MRVKPSNGILTIGITGLLFGLPACSEKDQTITLENGEEIMINDGQGNQALMVNREGIFKVVIQNEDSLSFGAKLDPTGFQELNALDKENRQAHFDKNGDGFFETCVLDEGEKFEIAPPRGWRNQDGSIQPGRQE